MFVVFRVTEPDKGYFKAKKQIKNVLNQPAVIHRKDGVLPFSEVEIIKGKRGIVWDGVEEKCGRYSSRIIAPKSIHLPDNFKRFSPSAIRANLVFNTAKKAIANAAAEPDSFCITITDRNALSAAKICSILPLCSCVRVVTARADRYAESVDNALNSFGATLIIRSEYEPVSKPDIVICCDGVTSAAMSESAVFTYKKRSFGKLRFYGSGITLTPEHSELLPDDIEALDFAGAITELCGCQDYAESCFSSIETSCEKCVSPSAESCLLCHIRGADQ